MAWDASHFYVGLEGSDVGLNSSNRFFTIYLSGPSGTTQGVAYKGQNPTLPFSAQWQVHWKGNNTNTRAVTWNGTAWVADNWVFTGKVHQTGNFVEMAIPFDKIGSPSTLSVHLSMINETTGGEWTFAGVPKGSFTDGFDPNYTKYFHFDLTGLHSPTQYPILP